MSDRTFWAVTAYCLVVTAFLAVTVTVFAPVFGLRP